MTPTQEFTKALILALRAPTDEQSRLAFDLAETLAVGLTQEQIKACKSAALQMAESNFAAAERYVALTKLSDLPLSQIPLIEMSKSQRLTWALVLCLTAPTDKQSAEVGSMVDSFAVGMSRAQIKACKSAALKMARPFMVRAGAA